MFAFVGLLVVVALVVGVIGLCFKDNRENEEYVDNVKHVAKEGFTWLILLPMLFFGGLFLAIVISVQK